MSISSKLDGLIMPKPKKEPEIPRPEDAPADGERTGTWKASGYSATDEEAHRNERYSISSSLRQTLTVFMVQMKLFSKMRWTYILLFTALLIPIIALLAPDFIDLLSTFGYSKGYSTTKIAGLLFFLPLMLGLMTSIMCGTQMPTEFKESTAYMNIPLPMSRASFFFGKYLAGFVMCLGIFMFAYSMAIATAMLDYDTIFPDLIASSIALTVIGVLAYSATAYTIGCLTKKGSSVFPFVLMSFILPLIILIICSQINDYALSLLPMFLGEAALGILGASMTGSVGMVILGSMDLTLTWLMAVIGIAWTAAMLIIGYLKTERREM
ncbi:MAG: hypothetical protein IKQ60_04320 [Candidatus Methanomethylophilaceae archaeon]|nr:hypothetical protein [Candidatus Methanomethylophilaceae archaeon]